ncbi:hypothetical protein [Gloeothece verrucosa]|uniref:Uncharacterized protein n=1 Tax=Gloeothece verrucosa (strain PCC 7822) TaxID=497965 RepID=E0U9G7_GLOV7|nr:hypothetical protein [Gloeothece verrucosa]ADN12659.1 hypothetical protein Cyan7822_0623 [Gloeothece verrucosa PCC 7822]
MKRVIQGLLALTFAIVVACGFQALPAHAQTVQSVCDTVSSINPCIVNLTNTKEQGVRISTGQVLLAVYTNNSYESPTSISLKTGTSEQSQVNLQPGQSVWKEYRFNSFNRVSVKATTANGATDATVVFVQADSQQT